MSNTIEQFEHRIAMIYDDLVQIRMFIYENNLDEIFLRKTHVSDEAWTLLNNIEIACDLNSDECLTWRAFNDPAEKIIKDLKAMDVDGETMQYILEQVGMSDQILKQLIVSSKTHDMAVFDYVRMNSEGKFDGFIYSFTSVIEEHNELLNKKWDEKFIPVSELTEEQLTQFNKTKSC